MIGRAWHALQIVCPELGIPAAVPLYLYYVYSTISCVLCIACQILWPATGWRQPLHVASSTLASTYKEPAY